MIRSSWPISLENVPLIRDHVENHLNTLGLDSKIIMHLCLVVEEVATNIVKYSGLNSESTITLEIEKKSSLIVIHVIDEGKPFNPLVAEEPDLGATLMSRKVGGLGVFFMKKLVDHIDYERNIDQNHLTITKKIKTVSD